MVSSGGASQFLISSESCKDSKTWTVGSNAHLHGHSWATKPFSALLPAGTVLSLPGDGVGEDPANWTIQCAVPLKLKCLFPFCKKSKSHYRELSFEKSIHPLKSTDSRFQIVPPLAGSQVTALYNPSLNNIHHDKWHHNSDIHNQSLL